MEINHEKMTIVYNKRTGDIKYIYEDEQKSELIFGEDVEAYLLIFDLLILDYDKDVFKNFILLSVVDGALKLKDSETLQKYI